MNQQRKLVATLVAFAAVIVLAGGAAFASLSEKALDICVYGVVGCLGLFISGNVGEHWTKGRAEPKIG